ncbi:MAG: 50S ribosomal protein L30 [Aquificaceae bacterium]|nr:50S ribosomal protein L30 [Aquificaceae bacterium]MDW8237753.1 50S ribosomal protein L30 [Aquificaceae bacterium]
MKLKITLMRGLAGKNKEQISALKGLGLSKRGQSRVLEKAPSVIGNLIKVKHLVKIEELKDA